MGIFKDHEKEESDPGEWRVYGTDPDTKKVVRFRLRAMPNTVSTQIDRRYFGNKSKVHYDRKGNRVIETERDKNVKATIDKAVWIAQESENFEGLAGDKEAADIYAALFGEPVEPGKPFLVDSHFSKREVRERVLGRNSEILDWIFEQHEEMQKLVVKAEEDLAKN